MQNREAFMRGANENGDAHRPAQIGNCEQGLHSGDIAHADAQAAVMLVDLRHPIGLDGLLDSDPHAMLVDVEEQQLFQRGRWSTGNFE